MILPGPVLKESRVAAGLTQAELARRLATTQSAVARLEAPDANPRFETFQWAIAATGNSLHVELEPSSYPPLDETMIVSSLRRSPAERLRHFSSAYASLRQLAPTVRKQDG
ncbi:MAG: helix-turn-helix transcriptional regulator [Solirubrobacterales bacterium]